MCRTRRLQGLHVLSGRACLLRWNQNLVRPLCPGNDWRLQVSPAAVEGTYLPNLCVQNVWNPAQVPTGWRPLIGGQVALAIAERQLLLHQHQHSVWSTAAIAQRGHSQGSRGAASLQDRQQEVSATFHTATFYLCSR